MPRALGITSLQILAAVRDGSSYGLDIGHSSRRRSEGGVSLFEKRNQLSAGR